MLTRDTVTHYLPASIDGRRHQWRLALCGATVRVNEATGTPSCPICRLRLKRLEEHDRAIDKDLSNWDRAVK